MAHLAEHDMVIAEETVLEDDTIMLTVNVN
jgi:hypothetical protein